MRAPERGEHYRFSGREFEQTPGGGQGQGTLVCCSPWGHKELDMTEQLSLSLMQETWVRSLSREDPLEKDMGTHSSVLAWEIPWTEEPGGLQSVGSRRVKHDLVTKQ